MAKVYHIVCLVTIEICTIKRPNLTLDLNNYSGMVGKTPMSWIVRILRLFGILQSGKATLKDKERIPKKKFSGRVPRGSGGYWWFIFYPFFSLITHIYF